MFEIDDNIHLDDWLVDFEQITKSLTDKASQTNKFDNTKKAEIKRLKNSVNDTLTADFWLYNMLVYTTLWAGYFIYFKFSPELF